MTAYLITALYAALCLGGVIHLAGMAVEAAQDNDLTVLALSVGISLPCVSLAIWGGFQMFAIASGAA